jgi:hypothetical protein
MINIIPENDIKEHTFDSTCDCCPKIEWDVEMIIIYNSFDGRELQGDGLPNKQWGIWQDS